MPLTFWSHAFQAAVYLINRMPSKILNFSTPYELLFNSTPSYHRLKIFGCLCYPWLKPYNQSKIQPKSTPCIFLGYSSSKSAYKCFDATTNRLFHSRHVEFVEHIVPLAGTSNGSPPATELVLTDFSSRNNKNKEIADNIPPPSLPLHPPPDLTIHVQQPIQTVSQPFSTQHEQQTSGTVIHDESTTTSSTPQSPSQPSSSEQSPTTTPNTHSPTNTSATNESENRVTRVRKPNSKYFNPSFINNTVVKQAQTTPPSKHPLLASLEPTCVSQAMQDSNWRDAMNAEFNALLQNGTWDLVPNDDRKNLVGCKWVFRIKRKPDGTIERYKARLVAKGFHQRPGIDFTETFSPVVKPTTIRIVLSLALSKGWSFQQLDINNAFLQGTLNDEVYMVQPPGFIHKSFPNYICKLKKAIYGLRQAPRDWHKELSSFLLINGFTHSISDASLFIYNRDGFIAYILVYVDDIVITGNNNNFLADLYRKFSARFSLKDLGSLNYFLGVEVIHLPHGCFLSQQKYIRDLLQRFKLDGAKEVVTPLSTSSSLTLLDGSAAADPTMFRQLVGALQYLSLTRPDVAFAVNKLSQFMHKPSQLHWQALKRVVRYLKGTIFHGLLVKRNVPLTLTGFSDADWGGNKDDFSSTTAYVIYLGSNIVSWKSSKQRTVARSSIEAEYRALAHASAEIQWIQNLLHELGVSFAQPPAIHCDNIGATYLSANPVFHSRMKHLALDYHFVRQQVQAGKLKVSYISTKDQLADAMTKPLSPQRFLFLRNKIGVSDGSSILRGRNS